MQYIKQTIAIAGLALSLYACKKSDAFLDKKSTTSTLSEERVFTDSILTMRFLGRIYQDIGFTFNRGMLDGAGNMDLATDDAESSLGNPSYRGNMIYQGTTNAFSPIWDFWNVPYANIRRVNLVLENISKTPLSDGMRQQVTAQARFLRVWFYFHLTRAFGGIPLIGDKVFGNEDFINLSRNKYSECVDYMVKELDELAAILPNSADYSDANYGRVSKGAAMALKARILLYAASPLFNGGSIASDAAQKEMVSYPAYSVARWQAAADAANAVINLNQYSLNVDNTTEPGYGFYNLFLQRVNTEYILAFYRGANRDFEGFYFPPTRGGAKNMVPTNNLVEAFLMKNGKMINEAGSGYDAANPYANRDPRLTYSVVYNGNKLFLQSAGNLVAVNTYQGAPQDGYPTTATGYYGCKMCERASSGNTTRAWSLLRYADVLLMYAEAINETGHPELAYAKLIELRSRAGIDAGADSQYGLKANMTIDEMREVIRNERHIELYAEDTRWDDIRRWKIALNINTGYSKCMQVVKNANNTFSYNIINSTFLRNNKAANYLLPIPNDEIRKMSALKQNPEY